MESGTEEPYLTLREKMQYFMMAHWRGVVIILTPIILTAVLIPFPPKPHQWSAFTLLLMAIFWVTECVPLAVTSFLPIVIFPLTDVMDTRTCCRCFINDSIMMFVGSLILAYSVEQSGLHKRLAYLTIRLIGYSHIKLLGAMCGFTTFASLWVTNTAATTMMVPINFELLKVFEEQKVLVIYDKTRDGDLVASDITTCYFLAATFSSTIGGIGTLVATSTNLVFKGLFVSAFPDAPEYLSFPKFSAYTIPLMITVEFSLYIFLIIYFFGFLRPHSETAKKSIMPKAARDAAKAAILADVKKTGIISYWELMVCILFGGAMILFFCRSPQLFIGWGDRIHEFHGIEDDKFLRDSTLAMFIGFWMFLLPRDLSFFQNFTARYVEDLPKTRACSVLDWGQLNSQVPFSFTFLLGGGFALSTAVKLTGLNELLGQQMQALKGLPNIVVILIIVIVIIFTTNFASNVAVCNVYTPIAMQLAKEIDQNPLWYAIVSGIAASFCFLVPVATPGNLIVQNAANIPTRKMVIAGIGPTIIAIVFNWLFSYFYAPVIWPVLHEFPDWISTGKIIL